MLLVVMRDIVLGTKVLDAAKRLKVVASMVDESIAPFAVRNATAVLIDFNDARLKPLLLLETIRKGWPQLRIVGVCGHANPAFGVAKSGGAEMLTNAEFAARLDEILVKYGRA